MAKMKAHKRPKVPLTNPYVAGLIQATHHLDEKESTASTCATQNSSVRSIEFLHVSNWAIPKHLAVLRTEATSTR